MFHLPLLTSRARAVLAALLGAALLSACGGGVSVGIGVDIGDGFHDEEPPSVSLVVSPTVAAPGQLLRLAAAASDDRGIEQVAFYRIDNGGTVLLFADGEPPYAIDTPAPLDGRRSVQYFARATDVHGRRRDSEAVAVTLQF